MFTKDSGGFAVLSPTPLWLKRLGTELSCAYVLSHEVIQGSRGRTLVSSYALLYRASVAATAPSSELQPKDVVCDPPDNASK
jgi:hypothetical protein